jgi:hypothetical protein
MNPFAKAQREAKPEKQADLIYDVKLCECSRLLAVKCDASG